MNDSPSGVIRPLALALTLPLAFAACDTTDSIATTTRTDSTPVLDTILVFEHGGRDCTGATGAVDYYVDSLTIPTLEQAQGGAIVGFDIDGVSNGCGLDDYQGQVDNALIAINGALGALPGDVDLQGQIDSGLCVDSETSEVAIELVVQVAQDVANGCATVAIYSGDTTGTALTSFNATLSGGTLSGFASSLSLTIPYEDATIALDIADMRFEGTVGASGLTNVRIGGALPFSALLTTVDGVLPSIHGGPCPGTDGCISLAMIEGIIGNVVDVPNSSNGECGDQGSLSVGLFATAGLERISDACPAAPSSSLRGARFE